MLNRREMCRLLTAGPAALALGTGSLAAEKKKPFTLRYVLASSMYGKMKLDDILPEVCKTGAEYIDLWTEYHANQREQIDAMGHDKFAELLRKHNVKLGMTTRYDLGPFGQQDEMRVLCKFGAGLVVTCAPRPKGLSDKERKAAVRRFVEQMKPHVAVAEELGVTIAIENHRGSLINSPETIRYFAELARSPNLGIALAPYHLPQDPQLLAGLIEDLGPKLVHFYAWQLGQGCVKKLPKPQELEQMPGRGKLDFVPIVAAMKKIDYQGWTEIFMHPTPRGIPIMPTVGQVAEEINHAREYLEECLRRVNQ